MIVVYNFLILLAYPITKYVLINRKLILVFELIKTKFDQRNNKIEGYGLKIFPV